MASVTTKSTSVDATALKVGANVTSAQNNLFTAYSLKEGATDTELKKLAKALGVTTANPNLRSLQLVAEQRFQQASQAYNMFSGILDKIDQIKQRIINKFSA
jgi:hypothetical protein